MKSRNIVGLCCVIGLSLFGMVLFMASKPAPKTRVLQLIPVASAPPSVVGPIRLASADLSPDGKNLLLTFHPDLKPFDVDDITLTFRFYERSPSGLVETRFRPTIDWKLWRIPLLGNKPRKLNLTSLGAFDELVMEMEYKSTLIDRRTFICK